MKRFNFFVIVFLFFSLFHLASVDYELSLEDKMIRIKSLTKIQMFSDESKMLRYLDQLYEDQGLYGDPEELKSRTDFELNMEDEMIIYFYLVKLSENPGSQSREVRRRIYSLASFFTKINIEPVVVDCLYNEIDLIRRNNSLENDHPTLPAALVANAKQVKSADHMYDSLRMLYPILRNPRIGQKTLMLCVQLVKDYISKDKNNMLIILETEYFELLMERVYANGAIIVKEEFEALVNLSFEKE